MRLFIFILVLFTLPAGQNLDRTDRLNNIRVVNVSAGNSAPPITDSRAIKSDCDCLIKYRVKREKGTGSYPVVDSLIGGVWYSVGPVDSVYRYTSGTTTTTCRAYDSTGTLVTGIKIAR